MNRFRPLGMVALMFSFAVAQLWAQRTMQCPADADPHAAIVAQIQRNMQRQRQKKRFEDMKRDSQKLLELATELKQYVDKTGENILSVDVIRKAEAMEKLARHVKDNMRGE